MTDRYKITILRDGEVVREQVCSGKLEHVTSDVIRLTFEQSVLILSGETMRIEYLHAGSPSH